MSNIVEMMRKKGMKISSEDDDFISVCDRDALYLYHKKNDHSSVSSMLTSYLLLHAFDFARN